MTFFLKLSLERVFYYHYTIMRVFLKQSYLKLYSHRHRRRDFIPYSCNIHIFLKLSFGFLYK